eukprot:GHVU01226060.1.p1 GENE.GHVU01226060.1~~GHVU01226060.1.p1  ORF type:complete len:103 (+),score=7.47 GHVU01226060.1:486-794(+)
MSTTALYQQQHYITSSTINNSTISTTALYQQQHYKQQHYITNSTDRPIISFSRGLSLRTASPPPSHPVPACLSASVPTTNAACVGVATRTGQPALWNVGAPL